MFNRIKRRNFFGLLGGLLFLPVIGAAKLKQASSEPETEKSQGTSCLDCNKCSAKFCRYYPG